jgi:glycosyltransferase involved in cell wall biosynthesis
MSAVASESLGDIRASRSASWADDGLGSTISAKVALRSSLIDWCTRHAAHQLDTNNPEGAARWVKTAATVAYEFGHSHFASARLEQLLLAAGAASPVAAPTVRACTAAMRWLHVFSITYNVGGHTNFAARWIEGQTGADVHDVVVTHQLAEDVSDYLRGVVERRGGRVLSLLSPHANTHLLARASALRRECDGQYNAVVLHVHPWDPVPLLAFCADGGPPVLLLNHADHVFWLGASVADMVLNLRPLGTLMTSNFRGVDRNFELPVPVPPPPHRADAADARQAVRRQLGVADDATVFLTVGTGEKYQPLGQLDWLQAARQICALLSNAVIIAVGPQLQAREWLQARADTGGRIVTVGPRTDVALYHAAADIYLEGFPFGSTTALLEAGLVGLPFVRAPREVPGVFKAGSPALADGDVPADVADYVRLACRLACDPEERQRLGLVGRQAIQSFHSGVAFNARLDQMKRHLPAIHVLSKIGETPHLPDEVERHWAAFKLPGEELFRRTRALAFTESLRALVDIRLWRELCRAHRAGCTRDSPTFLLVASHLMAILPRAVTWWLLALRRRARRTQ